MKHYELNYLISPDFSAEELKEADWIVPTLAEAHDEAIMW